MWIKSNQTELHTWYNQTMQKTLLLGAFAVTMLSFIVTSQNAVALSGSGFDRDLSIGMNGEDILSLQHLLNEHEDTIVAYYGPGSRGNETTYFGAKTKTAVVKFQEKYSREILTPAGLSSGTGYVGLFTRSKLNTLLSNSQTEKLSQLKVPIESPNESSQASSTNFRSERDLFLRESLARGVIPQWAAFSAISQNDVRIFGLSHERIKPGDSLSISGFGFGSDPIVHLGEEISVRAEVISNNEIAVKIPPYLSYGTYALWVSNERGNTRYKTPFDVIIAETTDVRPTIISVFPTRADNNTLVTVTADRLDLSDNKIYSSLGIIRSVPSGDGRTMKFKVSDLPNANQFFNDKSVNEFTVTFGIGTSQGLSVNYGYFVLAK